MKKNKLVIFGTGEIAELADFYFTHDSNYEVVAFTSDAEYIKSATFRNKPLVAFEDLQEKYPPSDYSLHIALSYSKLNLTRQVKYEEAKEKNYTLANYICSKSVFWWDLQLGDNCFILENQTIQPTVKIGNNVMIWSGNHLGHGCEIKDHAYLSSHICISGHTVIGERCFIGVNSSFKDFITIGDRVFVAMGATVTRDVASDSVVIGSKTSVYSEESEIASKIRKNYFGL